MMTECYGGDMGEDASAPRTHRINIRVMVPPGQTSLLLEDILNFIRDRAVHILGAEMTLEDDDSPSDPSVLR